MTNNMRSTDILYENNAPSTMRQTVFILAVLFWTVFTLSILLWSLEQVDQRILNSALVQARSSIEQDIRYRRWNASHGGVYGEVSDSLKPNQYLKIPDRDIITPSGKVLTKINPAYMTRQAHTHGAIESGVIGHLTSLNPVRPENKADPWETEALKAMRTDPSLKSTVEEREGGAYLRAMLPLITEKGCLKCHEEQGYKLGEIRGGISSSVPLAPLFKNAWRERLGLMTVFSLAWLLGCAIIIGIYRHTKIETNLRRSEAKYRTLVETMSEGTLIIDNQGKILFASTPMGKMLGRSPENLENMNFQEFISPNSTSTFNQGLESCAVGKVNSFEIELIKHNNTTIFTLFSPQLLEDKRNENLGILSTVTNITNQKTLENELFRRKRLSSLGLLAGGIAHEINTPTQYLKTNTSFIQNTFEDISGTLRTLQEFMPRIRQNTELQDETKPLEEMVDKIEADNLLEEVDRALNENMQGINRISDIVLSVKSLAGTGPVYPETVAPNSLIEKSLDLTRNSWEPVAELDLRLAEGLPDVKCIPRDIIQVITALITNASDAILENRRSMDTEAAGRITIETQVKDHNLTIVVADNGTGISDDDINKIFEPFYTTKDPGKGVGQGLAIANRVIEDHNGSLTVKSELGVGTEFTLSIPA